MKHNIKFLCTILCVGLAFCLTIPLVNTISISFAESEAIVQDVDFFSRANTYNATLTETPVRGSENDTYNSVAYDLSNRRPDAIVSTEAPQVTFITHGLGGKASHWSNDSKNGNWNFAYSDDSIIELLRQKADCNVYLARLNSNAEPGIKSFSVLLNQLSSNDYTVHDSGENKNLIDAITNNTKHSIVIFDAENSSQSNDYIYTQFNIMASKVVLDLQALDANHALPRVNLIGHSRGGLTNLQYALDHPDLVDSIFSLGTPYLGSTSASIDNYLLDGWGAGNSYGEDDITDPSVYLGYLNRWNTNYNSLYSNINVYAMGGYQSMDMLVYELVYQYIKDYVGNDFVNFSAKTLLKSINILLSLKLEILNSGISNVLKQEIISEILNIVYRIVPTLQNNTTVVNGITAALNLLFDELQYNPLTLSYDLLNDGLVDLPSQLGMDHQSDNMYHGFTHFTKRFGIYGNYDLDKSSVNDLRVTHNLEARDTQMLAYIVKNIEMSAVRNNSPYLVVDANTSETPNAVNIIGYIGKNVSGTLTIPEQIYITDGGNTPKTIVGISNGAFANNMNDEPDITSVVIPSTVKTIEAGAFYNNEFLQSISFASDTSALTSIGERAFCDMPNLTSFTIPSSVTFIGNGAFSGCNNLNIVMNGNNTSYYVNGNIIYTADGTRIVTSGKISNEITIPSTVTEISDYAFYNNSNLETISFGNGTPVIGDYAFAGCSNLSDAYFYDYVAPEVGVNSFPLNNFTAYVPHSKQLDYATALDSFNITFDSVPLTVTFVDRGNIMSTYNVHYGETINILPPMFRSGYTFDGWFKNDDFSGEEYQLNDLWNSVTDITVYAKWTANKYTISFNGYGCENLEDVTVTYDCAIGKLPVIEKIGYTFYGWKDQYGEYYTENNLWQKTKSVSVMPDLRANQYTITFNANGGQANIASQSARFEDVVNTLATASKNGHAFLGWNTSPDGSGQLITAPFLYNFASNITLYAQYSPKEYSVVFNKCNGVGGSDGVNAVFGYPMPEGSSITAPTRVGYTFDGYYQSELDNSAKYYDSSMHSTRNWDIARTATLYAHWIPVEYEVALDNQINPGFEQEITSNSSNDIREIVFKPLENGTITIWTMHTIGDPYLYLYNSNKSQLAYNDDGNGNSDSKIVYSVTAGTEYIVGFRACGSTTVGKVYCSGVALMSETNYTINVTYGSPLPNLKITVHRAGYVFQGFYSQPHGAGTIYYDSGLNAVNAWNIAENSTIYAHWIPQRYTITFDKKGGIGGSQMANATYLSTLPDNVSSPTRNGYIFGGYFTEENGLGISYYNGDMIPERKWDIADDIVLYAKWIAKTYTVTLNSGGNGGTASVTATFGLPMPTSSNIIAPQKTGYTFMGYYTGQNGTGQQYYEGPNMSSCANWNIANNTTLYAYFAPNTYTVTLTSNGDFTNEYKIIVTYGQPLPEVNKFAPKKSGYAFDGYYSPSGIRYYKMALLNDQQTADLNLLDEAFMESVVPENRVWDIAADTVLTGRWSSKSFECDSTYWSFCDTEFIGGATAHFVHGKTVITPASIQGYEFDHFEYLGKTYSAGQSIPVKVYRGTSVQKDQNGNYLRDSQGNLISYFHVQGMVYAYYNKKSCVTKGTLITLANGQQVPVESLTGDEMLLVWNMYTGQFDTAPILFIDSDPLRQYKVINLSFSDGTIVKVVSEHAFWDYTLNKYIYLREDAAQYIGHYFNKHGFDSDGNLTSYSVQLVDVNITQENTTVYSPVTYSHLCYYVNGMLSMPGGIEGLFNIFDVDATLMKYNQESLKADIEVYGLFTYEELSQMIPISVETFNAINAQYLKVAIGKGLVTIDELATLYMRYFEFLN